MTISLTQAELWASVIASITAGGFMALGIYMLKIGRLAAGAAMLALCGLELAVVYLTVTGINPWPILGSISIGLLFTALSLLSSDQPSN